MTLVSLIPALRGSLFFVGVGVLLGLIWSLVTVTPNPFLSVDAFISNEIDRFTARKIRDLLDPKGSRWIGEEEAVFLFFISLGLAGGLVGAICYHHPEIHAAMCPLVAPLSRESCSGA